MQLFRRTAVLRRRLSSSAATTASTISYACGVSTEPLHGLTIGATLDAVAASHAERLAVIAPTQRRTYGAGLTYAQLIELTNVVAASLLRLGLTQGDKVALWSPNCCEWVITQMACAKAGLVLVSINPASRSSELEYALRKVSCAALILALRDDFTDYVSILASIAPEIVEAHSPASLRVSRLPALRHVIVLDAESTTLHKESGGRLPGHHHPAGAHTWGELTRMAGAADISDMEAAAANIDSDALCAVQYTSGTTGAPKAAGLSHHNILNNAILATATQGLTQFDTILCNVPMFHCFGQVLASLGIFSRGGALLLPSPRFDADLSLRAAAAAGATSLYAVPTMVVRLLQSPLLPQLRPQLVGRLRTGILAGSTVPVSLVRALATELGIHGITIGYGMTETSPLSFQTAPDDPEWARCETIGRVLPHTEAKIIDPVTGHIVPRGKIGELCTRGYLVMRAGYLGDEAKTAEAVQGGWMHSGDLASMDAEGYVAIVGRSKDVIIRGGENVYPREVEEFILQCEAVRDVAVYGIKDEVFGEQVAASIILKQPVPGPDDDSETPGTAKAEAVAALQMFCKGRIASFKIPRFMRIVDSFPLTTSGKIMKYVLRAEAEERRKSRSQKSSP